MEDKDRIIDKVRKLMAVATSDATGNGVEFEQENALRQALALLAKHNLSMSDLDELEDKEDRDSVEITEEFPCPWRRVIAIAVSKLFFCEFFYTQVPGKQKYKFTFVGLESNAITAKEMTQYLLKTLGKESMKLQKEQGQTVAFGTTFRNAAAARISKRCDALRAEAEAASQPSTGTALVLASVYDQEKRLNDEYIEKIMGVKLTQRKIKGDLKSRSGLVQGDEYGRKVSLNRQLNASIPPRTLALGMS